MTDVKGIPSLERLWVTIIAENGSRFYITSKSSDRSMYYIYQEVDGKAVKLAKGDNPRKLEEDSLKKSEKNFEKTNLERAKLVVE